MSVICGAPCRRIKDPITFTCALMAVVMQRNSDQVVAPDALARAVPFQRTEGAALPPSFFLAVARFRLQQLQMEPS